MPYAVDEEMESVTSKKSQCTNLSNQSSSGGGSESGEFGAATRPVHNAPTVGKREETRVLRARCLVALILLLAASGVASAANLLVQQQERKEFENKFEAYATEILTTSRSKASQLFDALDSFASSIGAQAAAEHAFHNTSWPFYRIPNWSVQAQKLAQLTGVDDPIVAMAPIVDEDERDQWNTFAEEQNPIWYEESIEHEGYTDFTVEQLLQRTIPFVHFYDPEDSYRPVPVPRPGEVLPYFQAYPAGLFSGLTIMITNVDILLASQQTEELYNVTKIARSPTLGFTRLRLLNELEVPGSQIMQPIYDGPDTEAEDRKMVAVIRVRLHWLDYFKNLLAEGEDGIVVVLESACPKVDEDLYQDLEAVQKKTSA